MSLHFSFFALQWNVNYSHLYPIILISTILKQSPLSLSVGVGGERFSFFSATPLLLRFLYRSVMMICICWSCGWWFPLVVRIDFGSGGSSDEVISVVGCCRLVVWCCGGGAKFPKISGGWSDRWCWVVVRRVIVHGLHMILLLFYLDYTFLVQWLVSEGLFDMWMDNS